MQAALESVEQSQTKQTVEIPPDLVERLIALIDPLVRSIEVVYIMRDISSADRVRWIEIEADKLRAEYGHRPLSDLLRRDLLNQLLP